MDLTAERLIKACRDDSTDAGITIFTDLEPLAGPGAPVKPAIYAGGLYQKGKRWVTIDGESKKVDVISIDNEPSQANRLEEQLMRNREKLGLPEIVLDLTPVGHLPAHLPRRISSFQFPHRNGDAYLRDSMLDGQKFPRTEIGSKIFEATADKPEALFEWFPQALLFGFWQSHLGKKGNQAKLARSWVSEIVGVEPADAETKKLGLKGDPLNLSIDEKVEFDELDYTAWTLSDKGKRLSEVGHGQVPVNPQEAAPAAVSFSSIFQHSSVSFAALRRINAPAEGRAMLVAMGLFAHVAAFGRAFSLRSGAELRPLEPEWTLLLEGGSESVAPLSGESAERLFHDCVRAAEEAGLPVGSRWPEPIVVTPADNLVKAIRGTWPAPGNGS